MFNTTVEARLVLMPSPINGNKIPQVRVIAQGRKFLVTDDALWLEDESVLRGIKRVKVATFESDSSLDREDQVRANARTYFPQIAESEIAEISRYFFPDEEV